ncbi:hypothetical protein C8A03DRAFT_39016 [Achaetomium macrosporum]|uniref:Uncharacterized protein n=1 Tax=Achaetomium macrosporum TaxID=79813 RepID=A0AAN7H6R1_9PEZI|nr:hypothetical protein C8A03DRAFT_39016 [Achaetomium macrosporum]
MTTSREHSVCLTGFLDGEAPDEFEKQIQARRFGELRERIERKRQEIESLNNGLFSASSVVESRFSSEQNGNIRLLTLVTIAYLPLSFTATIYGMNDLSVSATIGSFFVVTAILSVIMFAIVFNLQLVTVFIRRQFFDKALASVLRDPGPQWRDRAQEGQSKRKPFPASKWLYIGYLFYRVFGRKVTPPSAEKGRRDDSNSV